MKPLLQVKVKAPSAWRAGLRVVASLAVLFALGCADGARIDASRADGPAPSVSEHARGGVGSGGDVGNSESTSGAWGGVARLVEEVSIGRESGDEPYLFGAVGDVVATDERIYVLDRQIQVVRAYAAETGTYLSNIGRRGMGPGEYDRPRFLDVDRRGLIYVKSGPEIEVFAPDGTSLSTWTLRPEATRTAPEKFTVGWDGTVYVFETLHDFGSEWRTFGVSTYRDGSFLSTERLPGIDFQETHFKIEVLRGNAVVQGEPRLPFMPRIAWTISKEGAIVIGAANRYAFEIHRDAGRGREISKSWVPIPVHPNEAAWYRRRLDARIRLASRTYGWDPENALPEYKPAFERFIPATDESIWVLRAGRGEYLEDCNESAVEPVEFYERPCWQDTYFFDVFEREGAFLGEVTLPPEFMNGRAQRPMPRPYIHNDTVIALVEDDSGTQFVKRYRIQRPNPRD